MERYAAFADSQLGRWGTRPDGSVVPGVRTMTAPLLQLFFGETVGLWIGFFVWNFPPTTLRRASGWVMLTSMMPKLPCCTLIGCCPGCLAAFRLLSMCNHSTTGRAVSTWVLQA